MQSGANFDDGAGDAGRSVARIDGENSIFGRREPARRETDLSPHYWEQCETESAKTLPRKAVRSMERVEVRKSKRKFPIKTLRAELMATQQFDCGRWKIALGARADRSRYETAMGMDFDSAAQELSMPPTITLEQAHGFGMFMLKAVISGRGDELIDLAKVNLLR